MKNLTRDEFLKLGLVHEINRLLLHPLGMALAIHMPEDESGGDAKVFTASVWDYREDPDGMVFAETTLNSNKSAKVSKMWEDKLELRSKNLGWMIQPVQGKSLSISHE